MLLVQKKGCSPVLQLLPTYGVSLFHRQKKRRLLLWPKVGHIPLKKMAGMPEKNLWATSGLLIPNAPPEFLLRYANGSQRNVLLDHFEEVIGHGYDIAFLANEELELLAKSWRDVGLDLCCSFFSAHRSQE